MSIFDRLDLSNGELPGWLNNLVALTRPLALTMTVAIPALGGFLVGFMAIWWPERADDMATLSVKFLSGIPDAGWGAITAIALGYTVAKSAEVMKKPPSPAGAPNPEGEPGIAPQPETELLPGIPGKTRLPVPQFGPDAGTEIME